MREVYYDDEGDFRGYRSYAVPVGWYRGLLRALPVKENDNERLDAECHDRSECGGRCGG